MSPGYIILLFKVSSVIKIHAPIRFTSFSWQGFPGRSQYPPFPSFRPSMSICGWWGCRIISLNSAATWQIKIKYKNKEAKRQKKQIQLKAKLYTIKYKYENIINTVDVIDNVINKSAGEQSVFTVIVQTDGSW